MKEEVIIVEDSSIKTKKLENEVNNILKTVKIHLLHLI
jgi:hypothetical protein